MARALFLGLVLFSSAGVSAAELAVAAAANVQFALDEVVALFHTNQTDIRVKVTYGSSGNLFAQIQNQAPFDLFLSADMDYPRKLAAAGLALDTPVFLYAAGRIVLWTPTLSAVEVETLGLRSLLAPSVRKVAVANPRLAPYGMAAVEAMKSFKLYEQVQPKLVFGENIAQTAQFVQSGNADVGVIALALALAPPLRDAGRYWEIPADAYSRIEQGGLILKRTQEATAARAFRDFLLSQRGCRVLERYGYRCRRKDEWIGKPSD